MTTSDGTGSTRTPSRGAAVIPLREHEVTWRAGTRAWEWACACGDSARGDDGPDGLNASVNAHWRGVPR